MFGLNNSFKNIYLTYINMDQYNDIPWRIINTYFKDNPTALIDHHLTSYNHFFKNGIQQLLKEKNPIRFIKGQDDTTKEFQYQAYLYIGGKNANRLYYGKPVIYDDDDNEHIMYPNEARLRNMTYAFTIHFDLEVDFKIKVFDKSGTITYENEETIIVPKIYLGKFPIMLQSDMCILKGLTSEVRYNMGECRNDLGGYFIIDGKEKVIICQEKFADNTLYIQDKVSDVYSYSAKIRSVSEDASKPVRTLAVRMVAEQASSTNGQIVVSIPNVRKPVPLFIVMRALGVISDKEIIKYCLLDLEDNEDLIELFRSSVHDAGLVFTQQAALGYIAYLTKGKSNSHTMEILMMYFLPHIGELNFKQKALYLGYIVNRLLRVVTGIEKPTNRDSYLYKRIEVSGMLIYDLFREYYTLQQKHIFLKMDKEHFYNKTTTKYKNAGFMNLILENIPVIFGNRIVENGFRKAFKGDWGSEAHTKRPGLLQDLSRLSYWSFLAQLRKTNLYIAADGAKILGPRLLNSTQWGILCPIHTPDGGNIGFHKHLSIFTHISSALSGYPFIKYLRTLGISLLEECSINFLSKTTKIFVNGAWIGVSDNIVELYNILKLAKRNGLFNPYISIRWNIERQELSILTDAGRPSHPLFHVNGDVISYQKDNVMDKINSNSLTWTECITGLAKKKKEIEYNSNYIYKINELYPQGVDLKQNEAIIEYLDTQEMEGAKLAMYTEDQVNYSKKKITHIEIHPSVILSVMANQINYPANNQFPRDLFSCGQSKQAVSVFHTNYQNRMDKTAYFLNYGQIPLVKSRYLEYTSKEQHPYGINAIVAVMSYTGYNVEDAVIINKNALDRGMFRTTYLSTYEAREDKVKVGNISIDKNFMDVNTHNVVGKKPGYDYSQLDPESGLIKENSIVNDKTILMGMATNSISSSDAFIDESISAKKGAMGYIDKSFMTRDEEGGRLAKVRLRQDRIPSIGDKFGSRAGQKGTIGIILEEADMPTTADGIRPDIIVNPHAFPSRMTIGHLVESLTGKACCLYGGFADCTAFINKGPKDKLFGDLLTRAGYNSTGNEIMYNGMTGEQLETEIYLGPTYYMRLKHMVKDKINYRARGPRTVLTRQTVQGRANDGGLRVGEMDRDAIIGYGMAGFLNESMMERGDKYYMAICNKSGTIAVYNESRNIFLSPIVDGPLKFVGNLENELNVVPISRFGREFSIVKVPYAFKLLYQELLTMNVQMRLITDDNVDQTVSLTKTDNVKILTDKNTFKEVEQETYDYLKKIDTTQIKPIIEEKTPNEDETPFETLTSDMYTDPWGELDYNMQNFGIFDTTGIQPSLSINIPQSTQKIPSTFHSSELELRKGDLVTYIDALNKGYDTNTLFTIITIDYDEGEGTIKAPDGKIFYTYVGELGDPPAYNPTSPPYNPETGSPVTTSPPYNPETGSPVTTSPPYNPTSPPYNPTSPPYNPKTGSPVTTSPPYNPTSPSVTVTDTRTITGPPELVLPPPQQITPSSSEQSLDVTSETLEDNEPSLVYEKEEEPENKIIRTIKTVDDSKGLPLLAGIAEEEDDSKKSESDIKKVTTDNK
jgi:DNA-directed RNA polymerase II subunit RPB2